MTPETLALYRDAAKAAERTSPPMSETAGRRLLDVTARSARRRKAA